MTDRPKNVLYVMRTWAMGGGQTIALLLQKHLDPARYNIIAAPFDAPGDGDEKYARAVERQGGQLADARIPWHSRRDAGRARETIRDLIDRYKIDLLHTHDPQSNTIVGMKRDQFPCAAVASPYGWFDRVFPLRSHLYTWAEKNLALPNFDRVVTVSETMRGKILAGRTPNERIRVINTGLDLTFLDDAKPRDAVRNALGIPQDAVVTGTISRIFIEKGHRFLIEAAQQLRERHPNHYLLIVGDGPLRSELEEQARQAGLSDRVVFTGFYDDLGGALNAMDIFAFPSILDEGFPTAVLEAQAAGLPVVASNKGGTHETIVAGETGLLVAPKRTAALAHALESLLGDPERRQAMGTAAADRIRSRFTLDKMLAAVSQTYDEAMERYAAHAHRD